MKISVDLGAVFKSGGELQRLIVYCDGSVTEMCGKRRSREQEIVSLFHSHHSAVKSNYAPSKTVSGRS